MLDGVTGAGIPDVQISINSIGKVITTSRDGDFWRLILPGSYNVTFHHVLYHSAFKLVTITSEKPYEFLNVSLVRRSIEDYAEAYAINSDSTNAFNAFMILLLFFFVKLRSQSSEGFLR